jgi:hypothetical protein
MSAVSHQVKVDEGEKEAKVERSENGDSSNTHVLPELTDGLIGHQSVPLFFGWSTEFFKVLWYAVVEDFSGSVSLGNLALIFFFFVAFIYYMQTTDASNNVRLKGVCVTTCPAEANTKFGTDECYEEKENQC